MTTSKRWDFLLQIELNETSLYFRETGFAGVYTNISTSNGTNLDFLFQGDLILQCDYLFEALTQLSVIANKQKSIQVVQGRYTRWRFVMSLKV